MKTFSPLALASLLFLPGRKLRRRDIPANQILADVPPADCD